jgi:hypothetical protein
MTKRDYIVTPHLEVLESYYDEFDFYYEFGLYSVKIIRLPKSHQN